MMQKCKHFVIRYGEPFCQLSQVRCDVMGPKQCFDYESKGRYEIMHKYTKQSRAAHRKAFLEWLLETGRITIKYSGGKPVRGGLREAERKFAWEKHHKKGWGFLRLGMHMGRSSKSVRKLLGEEYDKKTGR